MAVFNTEAIVLKQFDIGEADKIITFYTKDEGKVRAVARGARKTGNKLSGLVQPFSYCDIKVYRGSIDSLDRINQVNNKYSFSLLREDLNKMAYASYIAEFVEKVGMEDDPEPAIFSLLLSTYHKLLNAAREKLDLINLTFKVRILNILGFQPELGECIKCSKKVKTKKENFFNIARGGVFCFRCNQEVNNEYTFNISGESLAILKIILNPEREIPGNLKTSPGAVKELDTLMDKFITYHLDIKLKSEEFLHMIRDLG